MSLQNVRQVVGSIKSSLFKNSNSFSIGMLKSHFKGTGLMFKEHQVYNHGDETRFIDWNMFAKTGNTYIKTFEEERNVEISVILDASATMFYGYNEVSKLQASIEICCLLYLLAKETSDYVHVIIVSDKLYNIPKLSGEKGITALLSLLEGQGILNSNGKVNSSFSFKENKSSRLLSIEIMKHLRKKRELVLLSDFNNFIDEKSLKKLTSQLNIHCFQMIAPLDEAENIPYLLHTTDDVIAQQSSVGIINFGKAFGPAENGIKRIKKLRVKDRYLEEFVKEML